MHIPAAVWVTADEAVDAVVDPDATPTDERNSGFKDEYLNNKLCWK